MAVKSFWVHAPGDSVGVAVEDIPAGRSVTGALMTGSGEVPITTVSEIPLGHKIALKAIASGDRVVEYAEVIGAATKDIRPGELVHTHNLRSLKWGGTA
jgi:(2R)-sulfolactate sulfo-lyase subunit alpha